MLTNKCAQSKIILVATFFVTIACGSATQTQSLSTEESDDTATGSVNDTEADTFHTEEIYDSETFTDSAVSNSDTQARPAIFSRFGNISTIAGACQIEDKGVNGWQAAFEGQAALAAELSRPHYAMADRAGNIYIADKDAHAIRMVAIDGFIHTIAGNGTAGDGPDGETIATESALNSPNGLWVLADGTVYILDLANNKIRKRTSDGLMHTVFTDEDGISLGRAIWVNDDETICYYSSGSAIKKWTQADGVTIFADGFHGLGALMMGSDNYLYVTDRAGNAVYRISEDGIKTIIAGTGSSNASGGDGLPATETALEGVRGIWILEGNDYFVATHEGSQIWYVDATGTIFLFIDGRDNDVHAGDGEPFDAPGPKISEVRGISQDASGNLIITENDCGYIRKVERLK